MTNLLDEDRMTRMRSSVLNAVDDDTRRRGQKLRRRLGFGSAAAVLLVVGTVGSSLMSTQTSDVDQSAAPSIESEVVARDGGTSLSAAAAPDEGMASSDSSFESDTSSEVAPVDARDVIVTGSADVTVKDPREAAAALTTWVENHGGRVDGRQVSDSGESVYAYLSLRVPATQVSATLGHLESIGDVNDVSISKDDVTGTTRDLDARIKALRISIDRLEGILAKAKTTNEVVAAEQSLTDRQAQLEQLVSQRNQIGEQVALATIDVSLSAHEKTSSVDPGGFRGGLKSGWNSLVDAVNAVVEGVGTALPWLGVLIVLYGAYRLARIVTRRR